MVNTAFKYWLLIAGVTFVTGIFAGFLLPTYLSPWFSLTEIETPADFGLSPFILFMLIWANNTSVLVMSFAFSPFLCLPPLVSLLLNGWMIGLAGKLVMSVSSAGLFLAGILPHGLIEIPAFILAEAAALRFGASTLTAIFGRMERSLIVPSLKQNGSYLVIALLLLIPAAGIEVFITPLAIS